MSETALTVHVERTRVPDVLRWVCHRPDLDVTPVPPPDSALGAMISDKVIDSVAVRAGDLLVRFVHPDDVDDADKLSAVHRAITETLLSDDWTAHPGHTDVTIRPRRTQPA